MLIIHPGNFYFNSGEGCIIHTRNNLYKRIIMEEVEVRPRYQEPGAPTIEEVQPGAQLSQCSADDPQGPPSRGLFTVLNDNIMIIVAIIIVIIIIAVAIYFLTKHGDGPSDRKPNQSPGIPDNQPPEAQLSEPMPGIKVPTGTIATEDDERVDKSTLLDLLARAEVPTVQHPHQNIKSDDEIMQLMESVVDVNQPVTPQSNETVVEPIMDASIVELLTEPSVEPAAETNISTRDDSVVESDPVPDSDAPCSKVLSTGKTCRNRAKEDGFCHLHGE